MPTHRWQPPLGPIVIRLVRLLDFLGRRAAIAMAQSTHNPSDSARFGCADGWFRAGEKHEI